MTLIDLANVAAESVADLLGELRLDPDVLPELPVRGHMRRDDPGPFVRLAEHDQC